VDTNRVPTALQSGPEVTPARAPNEDTSGTIQPDLSNPSHRNIQRTTVTTDASNLGPFSVLSSTSSEKFNDTSSSQPLRSNNDHLAQPLQQPSVRFPELNSSRRDTRMNDENGIDWIVPKEEKKRRVEDSQSENVCNLPSTLLSLRRTNVLQKPNGRELR